MDWFGSRQKKRTEVIGRILGARWMMRDGMAARLGAPNAQMFVGACRASSGAALAITDYLKGAKKPEPVFALMASILMLYHSRAVIYAEGGEFDQPHTEDDLFYLDSALEVLTVTPQLAFEAAEMVDVKLEPNLLGLAQKPDIEPRKRAGYLFMALWQVSVHPTVSLPERRR